MSVKSNIFLIGLMGSGKTTIGKQIAERLKKTFYDSDHEIEKRTGVSIPVIFDIEGEEGFRNRETRMLDELTQKENVVVATGGGAILREANRAYLRDRGTVIYLRADIDELLKRTRRDRNRPLLNNGARCATLEKLLQQREPLYQQEADVEVDTGSLLATQVAKNIIALLVADK
jgi:shikimate kinase